MDAFAFVSSGFATKHATVASIAFLFYDYLITLDAEMNLVWNHRWSFGKVLFIFNRYFGAFALLFNTIVLFSGSVIDPLYVFLLRGIGHAFIDYSSCKLFLWWQGASRSNTKRRRYMPFLHVPEGSP
ncbi:hypothetical protein K439DRAFT_731533 [Ramaria rubella]|nr:hypothetical protein K439DRAFT_731533 [Ramaria rubella]